MYVLYTKISWQYNATKKHLYLPTININTLTFTLATRNFAVYCDRTLTLAMSVYIIWTHSLRIVQIQLFSFRFWSLVLNLCVCFFRFINTSSVFYQFSCVFWTDKNNKAMYEFLVDATKQSESFTKVYFKVIASIKSVAVTILLIKLTIFSLVVGMQKYHNTSYQMAYEIQLNLFKYSTLISIEIWIFSMFKGTLGWKYSVQ